MSIRRRFLHPIWLIVSLPGYIGWRLLPGLSLGTAGTLAGVALLLGACVLVPLSVGMRTTTLRRATADRIAWVGLTTMGFLSSLFVMTLLKDLVLLTVAVVSVPQARALATPSARWALGLTLLFTLIGLVIARRPRLVQIDVSIANLPAALQGFSIAQISDLHVGPTIKRGFVERIVARVNHLDADVIAITGDLVDGSVPDLSAHTAPLANLAAPHGVYMVTGNHEYYSGEPAWTAELRRLGLTVLKNQHVVLRSNGALLILAGVTDFTAHHFDAAQRSDPAGALLGSPVGIPKILLAHQPSTAAAAADAGYDLQISGHTHGGQFWPWNFFVRYFQPFTAGLNRLSNLWVYVSRGTGYWGPPNRFIVPAEITRIRLIAA